MRLTISARAAALAAVTVVAAVCGTGTTRSASAEVTPAGRECHEVPVWDRAIYPSEMPDDAFGDSPEEAVQSLADARGIGIDVTSTGPVEPGGDPEDDLAATVVDDLGRDGVYTLAEVDGAWVVSSGNGCGAPSPTSFDVADKACPLPSDLPTPAPGETIRGIQIC